MPRLPEESGTPALRLKAPGYRRALLALFAAGVSAFAMIYVVQPLLPLVSAEIGIDATRASLLLSVSTLAIALAVIPLAGLAERVGRDRIMSWGLSAVVVAGLAPAAAPTFALMLLARGVQGAALAALPAAALAWVAENIAPGWITRAAGLYVAGTTVGGMAGRVLGGVVADLTGWRVSVVAVTAVAGGSSWPSTSCCRRHALAVAQAPTAGHSPDMRPTGTA